MATVYVVPKALLEQAFGHRHGELSNGNTVTNFGFTLIISGLQT
jgi:hypothetical protein